MGLGDLREKIICKQCKNEATSKILHRVNSLICAPNKKKSPLSTVDWAWKTNSSQTKSPLCPPKNTFIYILFYKCRKNRIAPGGSQFTCYNLSVLSLCLKERPK